MGIAIEAVLHSYTLKAYAHIVSDGSVNHPYSFNPFVLFHVLAISSPLYFHSLSPPHSVHCSLTASLYLFIDELWGFSRVLESQYGTRPFPSN